MKIKHCFIFLCIILLMAAVIISCPVSDDHESVGRRAVVTFDTGDINPRTGQLTSATIPPSTTVNLIVGDVIDNFPTPFWVEGETTHFFNGWYSSPDAETGYPIALPYTVPGETILYAWWGREAVVFDANGGNIVIEGVGSYSSIELAVRRPPWELNSIPYPVKGSDAFLGWWFTNTSGNEEELTQATNIRDILPSLGSRNAVARWGTGSQTFTITFNANGGNWGPGVFTQTRTITVPANKTLGEIDAWVADPDLQGFPLIGWFTPEGVLFTEDSFVTRNLTVTARWVYSPVERVTYRLNDSNEMVGFFDDGASISITANIGASAQVVNDRRVIRLNNQANDVDFGQLAGSYMADTQWTVELFINFGDGPVTNRRVFVFHTGNGETADGAIWIEHNGLVVYRPNTGTRIDFQLTTADTRNRWYHLAMVRNGSMLYAYRNGERVTASDNFPLNNAAFRNVIHCRLFNLNNGFFHQMVLSNRAKSAGDFAADGVMDIVNALNGD